MSLQFLHSVTVGLQHICWNCLTRSCGRLWTIRKGFGIAAKRISDLIFADDKVLIAKDKATQVRW